KLMYTPRKGARMLYKAIQSAVSNAKNTLKVEGDMLQFKTLLIEEGQKLKRMRAGGRGMAKPFKRKYSHIKIILIAKEVKTEPKQIAEDTSKVKSQKLPAGKAGSKVVVSKTKRQVKTK
ncbi:MAG: uL22 family ribosomal protein, partial [Patescibacteria group bacterium]